MPPTLSKPSGFAPTSLFYITLGALMTVWSAIWFYYLHNHSSGDGVANYVCLGTLVTGLVLLVIGFGMGPVARWSRQAELPPPEAPAASPHPGAQNVTARRA